MLDIADAVLHPLHLEHPSRRNIFDLDEDVAMITRRKLLDRTAVEKISVLAYHFPFPGQHSQAEKSANDLQPPRPQTEKLVLSKPIVKGP